jgi:hypothetical protein
MTAHIESVLGAPHSLEPVVLLSLVLVFLIIEIPLVVSIFKAGSMEERSQKMDPGSLARPLPGPDRP